MGENSDRYMYRNTKSRNNYVKKKKCCKKSVIFELEVEYGSV